MQVTLLQTTLYNFNNSSNINMSILLISEKKFFKLNILPRLFETHHEKAVMY